MKTLTIESRRTAALLGAALTLLFVEGSAAAQTPPPSVSAPQQPAALPPVSPPPATAIPEQATPPEGPGANVTPITLESAISRALERNPTYEVARAEIKRFEAIRREVQASWLPTLSGNAYYTHIDNPRIQGGAVVIPQNGLTANLLLSVPIVAARQWANSSEANDNVETQRASTGDIRRQIALSTGQAYLAVFSQKLVIEVDTRARDTAKRHYDYAHKRYAGGVGTSLDEVRAAQEVANDEVLLQQAYASLVTTQEQLGILVGSDTPLDSTSEPSLATPPTLREGIRDAEQRTDVVAAQRKQRAAERVTHHDYTDYLPYLTGLAEPIYQDPATPTVPESGYQLELVLTIPLYDGGLRYGQARERSALLDEAKVGFEGLVRQARSDVRTDFEALRRADQALKASRDAAQLAKQALDLANLAYTAGATSDLEVIDAERAARDAETQAELSADTARQARLTLLSVTNHLP